METGYSDEPSEAVQKCGSDMIRQALLTWQKVTGNLLATLEKVVEETRDESIEMINQLLDVRDKLQPGIGAPFTAEEEAFGKEIVVLEAELQKKLAFFTKQIQNDISEAQSKKGQVKNYVNPYGNIMRDGMYYDTKQ